MAQLRRMQSRLDMEMLDIVVDHICSADYG